MGGEVGDDAATDGDGVVKPFVAFDEFFDGDTATPGHAEFDEGALKTGSVVNTCGA